MAAPRMEIQSIAGTSRLYYLCVHIANEDHNKNYTTHHSKKSSTSGLTSQDLQRRKQTLCTRMEELTHVFAMRVSAFTLQPHRFYLIVRIDKNKAERLSRQEVIERGMQLYSCPSVLARFKKSENLPLEEILLLEEIVKHWRKRLSDATWFIRALLQTDTPHQTKKLLLSD